MPHSAVPHLSILNYSNIFCDIQRRVTKMVRETENTSQDKNAYKTDPT